MWTAMFTRIIAALVHFSTTVEFLSYLFAGAALALPAQPSCKYCQHAMFASDVKAGTFCTLTYNTHHCRFAVSAHSSALVKITMCSQGGCLLPPDQSVVSSVAKFRSCRTIALGSPIVVTRATGDTPTKEGYEASFLVLSCNPMQNWVFRKSCG